MNPLSIRLLTTSVLAATCGSSVASDVRPLDLSALKLGPGVTLVSQGEQTVLRISGSQAGGRQNVLIFDLERPAVSQESYAIVGEVRYEGMPGGSFLELWNHFPTEKGGREIGGSYFSRTLAESGPMGQLNGNSEWRAFQLPFFMNDGSGRRPLRLTCNVQFAQGQGGGVVDIRGLQFIDGLQQGKAVAMTAWSPMALLVLGLVAGAVLATGIAILMWHVNRRRIRRELRRIQAVDAKAGS